jgi:hypothetical protein
MSIFFSETPPSTDLNSIPHLFVLNFSHIQIEVLVIISLSTEACFMNLRRLVFRKRQKNVCLLSQ